MEIWKDIPNYNGYQVSNLGRIRTYNKTTYTNKHGIRRWKNRILKFKPDHNSKHNGKVGTGYRISLWGNGKSKDFLVARLVAFTFLEQDINSDLTVNHINGNRLDNKLENLEIISLKENIQHGFKTGLYHTAYKTKIREIATNKTFIFESMVKASNYIGHCNNYIANCLRKNINHNQLYEWELVA